MNIQRVSVRNQKMLDMWSTAKRSWRSKQCLLARRPSRTSSWATLSGAARETSDGPSQKCVKHFLAMLGDSEFWLALLSPCNTTYASSFARLLNCRPTVPFEAQYPRTQTNARTAADNSTQGLGQKSNATDETMKIFCAVALGRAGRACRRRSPRILSGVIPFAMHEGIQYPHSLHLSQARFATQAQAGIIPRHLVT